MSEKNIEVLRDIVSIQGSDGNWNANEYMKLRLDKGAQAEFVALVLED